MKFQTLIALMCTASVDAVDFDGDGIDDTTAEEHVACTDDCWYESDEVQESKLTWKDYAAQKEFVMLAAMSANQTADGDGNDELGVFKVELFKNDVYVEDLFNHDLNDADTNDDFGTYENGWKKQFSGRGATQGFTYDGEESCYLKMSMEELDSNGVTAMCEVVLPCNNSPYAYAPCWIKGVDANGDYDNTGTGENRHGFYMLTYSIRDKHEMADWGSCDIKRNCRFRMFGKGFFCRNQA